MRYLLDSNIICNAVDYPRGPVARRIRDASRISTIFTSVIVVSELRYGYTKISSRRLEAAYEVFFEGVPIENWEAPFDQVYAEMRCGLERQGRTMGAMDMLIATHALATDATVVTDDRAFLQVDGLKTENWLRDEPAPLE